MWFMLMRTLVCLYVCACVRCLITYLRHDVHTVLVNVVLMLVYNTKYKPL